MDIITLNNLFSKNELWFNENIHSNLISKILSSLIDKKSEKILEQDEYFIQATINDYLIRQLSNTKFTSKRELENIDITVIHTNKVEPIVLYEVKSYIKKSESKIKPKDIYKDILKLTIKKKELPYINAFMLIAGKTKVLKDAFENKKLLIPDKFNNIKNRRAMVLNLEFFELQNLDAKLIEKARKLNIKQISISPSRWKNYDGMCVATWKINKIK